MKLLLITVIVLIVLVALAIAFRRRDSTALSDEPWPFYEKKLLSEPEQILYHRLVKALPECLVLAQVQLSRMLGVRRGSGFEWRNRISQLSVDFVVCLKDSSVVVAIELDDSSHESPKRRETDAKKDKALEDAGVPMLRWSVKALPDETAIRAAIAQ
jgi:very-short-patch-repair endonuclease